MLGVAICFSWPLYRLVKFALQNDLYSHIILVPFISVSHLDKEVSCCPKVRTQIEKSHWLLFQLVRFCLRVIGEQFLQESSSRKKTPLPWAFFRSCFLDGACAWFLSPQILRALLFPLAFLIFMLPFPVMIRTDLEVFLQHGSADIAYLFFKLSGTTVFYYDLIFRLPGINLEVAPECSGIRSEASALFITSLLAGYLFPAHAHGNVRFSPLP